MSEYYEQRRFDFQGGGYRREAIQLQLQPLGDEAWEIMYVGQIRPLGGLVPTGHWVEARRPPYGTPAPSSWEYTGFNIAGMPSPEWDNHVGSRGWIKVLDAWYQYYFQTWYVFKRPGHWRGSDDGDILHQLESAGAHMGGDPNIRLPWRPGLWMKRVEDTVREILQIKWELSERSGADVGTHAAVQQWLARQ